MHFSNEMYSEFLFVIGNQQNIMCINPLILWFPSLNLSWAQDYQINFLELFSNLMLTLQQ